MVETWPEEIFESLLQKFNGKIPESHLFYAHEGVPTRAQLYDFLKRYRDGILENRRELEMWQDFLNAYIYYATNRKLNQLNFQDVRTNQGIDAYYASLDELVNNKGSLQVTKSQMDVVRAEIEAGTFNPNAVIVKLVGIRPSLLPASGNWRSGFVSPEGKTIIARISNDPTGKVYVSNDGGINWSLSGVLPKSNATPYFLSNSDASRLVGLNDSADTRAYWSPDGGAKWYTLPDFPDQAGINGFKFGWMSEDAKVIRAFSSRGRAALEYKNSKWTALPDPYAAGGLSTNTPIIAISKDGNTVVIPSKNKVAISKDGGHSWTYKTLPVGTERDTWFSGGISDDTNTIGFFSSSNKTLISKDGGATWKVTTLDSSLGRSFRNGMVSSDGTKMSAVNFGKPTGIYSADGGDTWEATTVGTEDLRWWNTGNNGQVSFVLANNSNKCALSPDAGKTWYVSNNTPGEEVNP